MADYFYNGVQSSMPLLPRGFCQQPLTDSQDVFSFDPHTFPNRDKGRVFYLQHHIPMLPYIEKHALQPHSDVLIMAQVHLDHRHFYYVPTNPYCLFLKKSPAI